MTAAGQPPPNPSYREYAKCWSDVKPAWGLSMQASEKEALIESLATCWAATTGVHDRKEHHTMGSATRAALTALTITCCTLTPVPAQAATPVGNAPMCVAVWQTTGRITKTGHARNDCDTRLRLRIAWSRGTDSACETVDPGKTISSRVPRGVRSFNGADTC
ncbi:hypothetical protein GCM10022224_061050 [Nonomuraea antimicrobica]|uniref:Uncharacterized protein n=1 Tax=Nonomuraea antimicrobica TaxID=561173 RepID=A0ABP7CES2_9ACTN